MFTIANCGNRAHAPENTVTACLSAYAAGADAARLPVRLSKDGNVVVAQDETTDRLTGQPGRIADLKLSDLRAMDFGKTFQESDGTPFRYPSRVETFAHLIDFLPDDFRIVVDFMPEPDAARREDLVTKTLAALRHRNLTERTVF